MGNYIRPHLHSERGITSEQAHASARERWLSGGISSLDIQAFAQDDPEEDDDPFAPSTPSRSDTQTPTAAASHAEVAECDYDDDSPRPAFESRQWKECTPVLEDPDGEDAAERSFSRLSPRDVEEEQEEGEEGGNPDESFASALRSLDLDEFHSPEKCRRREHTWHALDLDLYSQSSLSLSTTSPQQEGLSENQSRDGEEDSADVCTPSLSDDGTARFGVASPRGSEDSYDSPSTPNTSIPLSSPGRELDWSPHSARGVKETAQQLDLDPAPVPTSTPPRATFLEVIETCPTPGSTISVRDTGPPRRRSLMTSGLGIAFSETPSPVREPSRPTTAQSDHTSTSQNSVRRPRERIQVVDPNFDSYSSSIYPDAAHWNTYTRRPRKPRPTIFQGDAPDALPFPHFSPQELVTSLLSYPGGPASGSTSHLPTPPSDDPAPSIPPPPQHLRPLHSPHLSPSFPHSNFFPIASTAGPRPSTSHFLRPFADLIPSSPSHHDQPVLRGQTSNSTLFTYDLHHLPAPRTPREQPYKVRPLSLILPTSFLGGGKGTGMYGDLGGAVERKAPPLPAAMSTTERQGKRRSLSLMNLPGLSKNSSTSRRRSLFGLSSLAGGCVGADGDISENPSREEVASHEPGTSFSRASAVAEVPRVDEFAVYYAGAAADTATGGRTKNRLRSHTPPPSRVLSASAPVSPSAQDSPKVKLKRGADIRRSLSRFSMSRKGSFAPEPSLATRITGQKRRGDQVDDGGAASPEVFEEDELDRRDRIAAEELRRKERTERRRSSLGLSSLSWFTAKEEQRGVDGQEEERREGLDQWIAVSVR
ncbi:hypothetical protein JCM11641_001555 [Rhodosporidiobolus odoratus]